MLVFFEQLAYDHTARFFDIALRRMQRFYSFFWEMWKIKNVKNVKMILQKVKYGDIENQKCDFRGWFYKFVGTSWYFFKKITKRSSKFAFFVKKYEICDFGGWFDNFRTFCCCFVFGEMGENRRRFIRTFIKRSPKNAKWVFARQKTRIGLFEDIIYTIFKNNIKWTIYKLTISSKNEY